MDKKVKILAILFFLSCVSFLALRFSRAYFSDTEKVLGNTIQVGIWGTTITPAPTEIIAPTPTETPTPTPTPEDSKINICHKSGPVNWGAIQIPQSAWPAHQGHGDFLYNGPVGADGKPTGDGDSWCANNLPPPV